MFIKYVFIWIFYYVFKNSSLNYKQIFICIRISLTEARSDSKIFYFCHTSSKLKYLWWIPLTFEIEIYHKYYRFYIAVVKVQNFTNAVYTNFLIYLFYWKSVNNSQCKLIVYFIEVLSKSNMLFKHFIAKLMIFSIFNEITEIFLALCICIEKQQITIN